MGEFFVSANEWVIDQNQAQILWVEDMKYDLSTFDMSNVYVKKGRKMTYFPKKNALFVPLAVLKKWAEFEAEN